MLVLALDTSTELGTVGLVRDSELLCELRFNIKISPHSERLIPAIDRVISSSNVSIKDLNLISVVIGPGSFTGLRVGLSCAKGLSFATGVPVVGVGTLDCLVRQLQGVKIPIVPLVDAKRNLIYSSIYVDEKPLFPPMALTYEELAQQLEKRSIFMVTGPAVELYKKRLAENFRENLVFSHPVARYISAFTVAELGTKIYQSNGAPELAGLEPIYIRGADVKLGKTII